MGIHVSYATQMPIVKGFDAWYRAWTVDTLPSEEAVSRSPPCTTRVPSSMKHIAPEYAVSKLKFHIQCNAVNVDTTTRNLEYWNTCALCVARRLAGHPSRVAYCDNDMVLAALYARVGGMMRRDKNVWARGVNMYHEDELELAITDPDNFQHGFHPPRASLRLHRARTLCGRSDDADPPHEASSGIVMNNAFIYLAAYHVVLRLARANNH